MVALPPAEDVIALQKQCLFFLWYRRPLLTDREWNARLQKISGRSAGTYYGLGFARHFCIYHFQGDSDSTVVVNQLHIEATR